jgi:type IV secretion system protein VirB10
MTRNARRAGYICALAVALTAAGAPARSAAAQGSYAVPDNTLIEGSLNTRLSASSARRGARFTLRVTSPNEYRGATVYGHVSDAKRSGRVRGKSEMTLVFDRIRMRDGRTYRFAGDVTAVRTPDGEDFDVDDEGAVEGGSQGDRTASRAGIGAVAGTIIGAIAGGGDAALAGAAIGGGVGAGSVLVQGRRNLTLERGTRLTIRSSAPR